MRIIDPFETLDGSHIAWPVRGPHTYVDHFEDLNRIQPTRSILSSITEVGTKSLVVLKAGADRLLHPEPKRVRVVAPLIWLRDGGNGMPAPDVGRTNIGFPIINGELPLDTAQRAANHLRGNTNTDAQDYLGISDREMGRFHQVAFEAEVRVQETRRLHLGKRGLWKTVARVPIPEAN